MHAMCIDDAYHVERVLAKNATGTTELVTLDGNGPFVRKKIPTKYARRAVWASLTDCHCLRLPQVETMYELPDCFCVVYDFVPSPTLKETIESAGPLEADEAIRLINDICAAAEALHEHGVIHRDISPANVVAAADGAHLIDLGIARMRVEGATKDTTFLGTFGFASPEQYGFAQTDARSDVYSIGCLLAYLLVGKSAEDENEYEKALEELGRSAPEVCAVIKKACAFEPSARYQSAKELAVALGEPDKPAKNVAPAWVEVEEGDTPSTSTKRRKLGLIALGVGIALAVVVIAALFIWVSRQAGEPSSRIVAAESPASQSLTIPSTSPKSADSDGQTFVASNDVSASDIIKIGDVSWFSNGSGFTNYVFTATNTGDSKTVELPEFEVTGRDEAGAITFVDTPSVMVIGPKQTVACIGILTDEEAPSSLDCTVKDSMATAVYTNLSVPTYSASNTSVTEDGYGHQTIVGELALDQVGEYNSGIGMIEVVALLKDAQGEVVAAGSTSLTAPKEGDSSSFAIDAFGATGWSTYELYISS